MNSIRRYTLGASILFAVIAALFGFAALWAGEAHAATLPAETCSYDGLTNTRTCELWAIAGTVDLPGWPDMPIWGYTDTDPALGGMAQLPGPTIIVNQGEFVEVILHNTLTETTSLVFPGQAMTPDLTGIEAGADNALSPYSFTASSPGTYLYEAGPLPNAQHQVAMGLYGALIVRPALNQAYGPDTAFDDEALLVLGDIDPALNGRVDPAAFDMRDYAPKFFLINGQAYPDTDEILSTAGNKVLLRYINAGIEQHSMGMLGVDQEILATDGNPLTYSFRVAAATIGSGQTRDVLVRIPAATLDGIRVALYDTSLLLHNNGAAGFGGMMTFLNVSAVAGGNGGAPMTSAVLALPSPTSGQEDVTVTAVITADATIVLTNTVAAAEFFIDVPGTDGNGMPMMAVDGAFDSANEGVTATLLAADVAALLDGTHTLYVHGLDDLGVWGPFATATLIVDTSGPTTVSVLVTPSPTDGTVDVSLSATIPDATAAEYFIDAQGTDGSGTPMTAGVGTDEWTGTILTGTLAGLATGDHTIYVHGQNLPGNWGAFNFAVLHLDKDGPTTQGLVLSPNPSSGSVAVSVSATGDDSASGNSNITAAEYFVDITGTHGSGIPMTVNVEAPIASLDGTIDAATMSTLAEGEHIVYVHSMDAFGWWGGNVTAALVVDQIGPTTGNVVADPNPNNGALPYSPTVYAVRVDATISDGISTVERAEGFINIIGDDGSGFPLTPSDGLFDESVEDAYVFIPLSTISALGAGTHQIYVHGQDTSGNWGATDFVDLVIETDIPTVTGVAVNPASTDGTVLVDLTATASDASSNIVMAEWFAGADPGAGNGNAMSISFNGLDWDLAATIDTNGWAPGDYTISVRARDVAGNWSLTDSTILTVTAGPPTVPALTYFSTSGNGAIPGVAAPHDDADVYLWDETVFSRVLDGTAEGGLPGNADIDGLAFDGGLFYLSFNRNGGTNVPGVGVVQDEDVVTYNPGDLQWELFFAGIDVCDGMDASNGHDIDAFDVVNGVIYFSTEGDAAMTGLAGPFDDADIYSVDPVLGCSRLFDASVEGLPGNADIDGLTVVDGDTFYMSFAQDGISVPVLGLVQDEDVILYDAGVWSLYFDGSVHDLGANGQSLDAIDVQ